MPIELQLQNLQKAYETLTPDNVDHLLSFYAADARFKDPFQEVNGHAEIKEIFLKMFDQLNNPRFRVKEIQNRNQQVSLLWEFHFEFKRWNQSPQMILGVSWLTLNDDGLIKRHHDFWDPAEGIYEKLPIIGSLMRFLKKSA